LIGRLLGREHNQIFIFEISAPQLFPGCLRASSISKNSHGVVHSAPPILFCLFKSNQCASQRAPIISGKSIEKSIDS